MSTTSKFKETLSAAFQKQSTKESAPLHYTADEIENFKNTVQSVFDLMQATPNNNSRTYSSSENSYITLKTAGRGQSSTFNITYGEHMRHWSHGNSEYAHTWQLTLRLGNKDDAYAGKSVVFIQKTTKDKSGWQRETTHAETEKTNYFSLDSLQQNLAKWLLEVAPQRAEAIVQTNDEQRPAQVQRGHKGQATARIKVPTIS